MIFNSFFGLLFDGYFNIVLCCFFNLAAPHNNIDKNTTNLILVILLLAVLLVLLPLFIIYIAFQPRKVLESKDFKDKFDLAYKDIRIHSKMNLLYRLFFCLRRSIFVYTIYYLYLMPTIQLLCFFYVNLMCTIYQGYYMPLKTKYSNRI